MVVLRARTVAAALLLVLSLSSSTLSSPYRSTRHSFLRFAHAETKTVSLQPFRGISICAPISVRIVDSSNASEGFSARLRGEKKAIDAISLTTTASSLSVELPHAEGFETGPGSFELEIRLPARTLQYVERVHAQGDTAILSSFDPEKAEVASSGIGNIWIPSLNGRGGGGGGGGGKKQKEQQRLQMAKVSLSAPGKVVAQGDAGFWEVFTADNAAEVRIDGVAEGGDGENPLYSTVSVRLDAGKARIQPSVSGKVENVVSITGFALAPRSAKPAELEYTSGECSARREVFGGVGPLSENEQGNLAALGTACKLVPPLQQPASSSPPPMSWTCAIRTSGKWTCGGPGDKGAKPGTVSTGTICAATKEELESISNV